MPSDQSGQALRDILENARLAQSFVSGLSRDLFAQDPKTIYAVTRCLEIISEASRRLDPDVRIRHPSLPWRAIMGAGNVYRHDDDNIDESQLWLTVNDSPPRLIAAMEQEPGGRSDGHA
jgi:uncharacterized protein with HEPN domain